VTDSVAIAFADRRSSRTAPTKRIPLRGKVLIRRCASPLSKQAPADFVTWKARAAADLKRQHNVNPGTIPVRLWRHLYIQGRSPQAAADQAALSAYNNQSAANRLWKR
jgi:hypothetical protein